MRLAQLGLATEDGATILMAMTAILVLAVLLTFVLIGTGVELTPNLLPWPTTSAPGGGTWIGPTTPR